MSDWRRVYGPHPPGECSRCGHDWDAHVLVWPEGNDPPSGHYYCPMDGCVCSGTWSASAPEVDGS